MLLTLLWTLWSIAEAQICLEGVTAYASSNGPNFYWYCPESNSTALLVECPAGQNYNRQQEACTLKEGKERRSGAASKDASSIIELPVLGRPVFLGDMYDARKDQVLNGLSFWREDSLEKDKRVELKEYSNTKFFAEQSEEDKMNRFDGKLAIQLTLMAGTVKVEGSAKYITDERASVKESRFNLEYDATTRIESLSNVYRTGSKKDFNLCNKIDKKNGPTHVVSSVLYGLKAIIVFAKIAKNESEYLEFGGKLKVTVEKFAAQGEAELEMTEDSSSFEESISVSMYGDIILEKNPSSFAEALDVYKTLPSRMGTAGDFYSKSAAIRMQLTPISAFCDETDGLLAGISEGLMNQAFKSLVDLNKLKLYTKTLVTTYIAARFIHMRQTLNLFNTALEVFILEYKKKVGEIIPAVRGGEGEENLVALIKDYTQSVFFYDVAYLFLYEREKEINTINHLFEEAQQLTSVIISDAAEANIAEALLKRKLVFLYKFNVFSSSDVTTDFLDEKSENYMKIPLETWFNDFSKIGKAGNVWRQFRQFVEDNIQPGSSYFLVGSTTSEDGSPAKIEVYIDGILWNGNFLVPAAPPVPTFEAKTAKKITLSLKEAAAAGEDNELITGIEVSTFTNGLSLEDDIPNKVFQKDVETVTIGNLSPLLKYQFEIRYVTKVGSGPWSVKTENITTHASSPPTDVTFNHPNARTVETSWKASKEVALSVTPIGYDVELFELKEPNEVKVYVERVSSTNVTLDDLSPATNYRVVVTPVFLSKIGTELRGLAEATLVVTRPDTPPPPTLVSAPTDSSATISLAEVLQSQVANGFDFSRFKIKFYETDEKNSMILGTGQERAVKAAESGQTIVVIDGLAQGVKYNFIYQIETKPSQNQTIQKIQLSPSSPPLTVKTTFNKTALEQFKEDLGIDNKIARLTDNLNVKIDGNSDKINEYNLKLNVNSGKISDNMRTIESMTSNRGSVCAYRHTVEAGTTWNLYDNLIVNEGHAGTQDLESGVFTAAATGLYIVSFDFYAYTTSGKFLTLRLYKNGEVLPETVTTMAIGYGLDHVYNTLGRTRAISLSTNDTLKLKIDTLYNGSDDKPTTLNKVVFCNTLLYSSG